MKSNRQPEIKVDYRRCHACAACVGICPTGALLLVDMHLAFEAQFCLSCGHCVQTCPMQALRLQTEVNHAVTL